MVGLRLVLPDARFFGERALKHTLFSLAVVVLLLALSPGRPRAGQTADAQGLSALRAEAASAVAAPASLPPEKARDSRTRAPLVAIDPGHGGDEVGAASNGVVEKHSNLDMAFRVEALLLAQGFDVLLTRHTDARAAPDPALPSVGGSATRGDLQARLDMANAAGANVWVSLHSNGSSDRSQNGVEVWYDPNRAFGEESFRLASLLLDDVVAELYAYGYPALNRGLKDDTCFRFRNSRCFQLYVLGPGRDPNRAGQMPGALVESLFISNPEDNWVLRDEAGRDAIARGIARAIGEFIRGRPAPNVQ